MESPTNRTRTVGPGAGPALTDAAEIAAGSVALAALAPVAVGTSNGTRVTAAADRQNRVKIFFIMHKLSRFNCRGMPRKESN